MRTTTWTLTTRNRDFHLLLITQGTPDLGPVLLVDLLEDLSDHLQHIQQHQKDLDGVEDIVQALVLGKFGGGNGEAMLWCFICGEVFFFSVLHNQTPIEDALWLYLG